jgi:RHS repeat-associated protein
MNRIVPLTLLALLLTGCRITTTVVGQGTVTSQSGNFNCSTGNVGACTRDYTTAGSEVFTAAPAPGWTFAKWTNCNYVSITSCGTSFGKNTATDNWVITATFKPINPPVQTASYSYNALGQRITKTVGTVTTLFQYDLDGNLIAELNSSGQALRQHLYVDNEPIAQLTRKTDGTIDAQYVHADHLGTPTLLTNQSGNVVADFEAMPFGETFVDYAEVEYNKRFPGQYKDAETGLHYNYFRDYDPSIGRYVQSDPIGLEGGLNTYAYVAGNPNRWGDPLGLRGLYCSRPLGNYTGQSGPGLHIFTCVTLPDGSFVCDSQNNPDDDSNPFSGNSQGVSSFPQRDNPDTGLCKEIDDDADRCFEDCMLGQYSSPRPNYAIGPLGTDCREWSRESTMQCLYQCRW